MSANLGPEINPQGEVRFAVVMYGGVSLAIYINGIAQELLRMVRATSPASHDANRALPVENKEGESLSGTEKVYRKVSYLLSNKDKRMKEWLHEAKKQNNETDKELKKPREELHKNLLNDWLDGADKKLNDRREDGTFEPINTQFIVDIISGTSAGGINGIYLAKALARNQDMSQLQQLWVEEGDIALLINDSKSLEDPYDLKQPPASLLNSQRMYVKLLKALTDMEKQEGAATPTADGKSPKSLYVKELDLFLPTTDILGVRLPIKLADSVVYERRHRNVFHFRYSNREGANDFEAKYNPFLAYAARCTSSFPFAFEPMTLSNIDDVVDTFLEYQDKKLYGADSENWEQFYKVYVEPTTILSRSVKFKQRAFGDGGYLDNKPFSYATETLMNRTADIPVSRKLIYIEPSPDHPEDRPEREGEPNVIENVMAALFTIPRYETIREDLQRILERNRIIQRVSRILKQVDADRELAHDKHRTKGLTEARLDEFAPNQLDLHNQIEGKRSDKKNKPLNDDEWAKLYLADMIERKGRAYVAYHRLEIGVVTDNLAAMITRIAGFNVDSDHSLSIQYLVRAWRDQHYAEKYDEASPGKPTLNDFLIKLDLTFPMRRLSFLRDKINELLRQGAGYDKLLRLSPDYKEELEKLRDFVCKEFSKLLDLRLKLESGKLPAEAEDIRKMIQESGLTVEDLDQILGRNKQDYVSGRIAGIMEEHFRETLYERQEIECKEKGSEKLSRKSNYPNKELPEKDRWTIGEVFDAIAHKLSDVIYYGLKQKSDIECLNKLAPEGSNLPEPILNRLSDYYRNYDDFDMFLFPLLHGTDIGERAVVEVTRISPEDATNLIDEKKAKCFKLAGTALGHFGAFLEKLWRQNDILWGRLDGAERLIASLLPDEPDLAKRLASEAQAAIVCEEIESRGKEELYRLLVESVMRTKSGSPDPDTLSQFICGLKSGATDPSLMEKLEGIDNKAIRDFYLEHYDISSQIEPEPALRSAARATTVVGQILEGLSSKYNRGAKAAVWVTRFGKIFWGLVEVAVPNSIYNMLFRHWMKLLYLFEVLLIVFGTVFSEISGFAWKALGITLGLHAAVLLLGDIMKYRLERWRITKTILVGAFVFLIGLGLLDLPDALPRMLGFLTSLGNAEIQDKPIVKIAGLLSFIWIAVSAWIVLRFNAVLSKLAELKLKFERNQNTQAEQKARTQPDRPEIPGGFRSWFVAIEFASSKDDIKKIFGHRGDARREAIRESVMAEFLFIAVYWLLFIAMSRILYSSATNFERSPVLFGDHSPYCALALSVIVVIAGTAAALADIVENRGILAILNMPPNEQAENQAEKIRRAAVLKFAMVFITIAVLALTFLLRTDWSRIIGYLYLAGALMGIVGLASPLRQLIEWAFLPIMGGLLATAAIFMFSPDGFLLRVTGTDACVWFSANKMIIMIGASIIAVLIAAFTFSARRRKA